MATSWSVLSVNAQQWIQTTSLPDAYQEHALVFANGFLYNIGGASSIRAEADGTNVFFAQVGTNGTVGAWNNTTSLPEGVYDHAAVAVDGFVYVLGGLHYTPTVGYDFFTNTVYSANINPDGTLGTWQTNSPLPEPHAFWGASAWNHRIYVSGGETATATDSKSVYSAKVQTNGVLSEWAMEAPLPNSPLAQAEVANGMVYVIGGVVNGGTTISSNVFYAKIGGNGTLASWNETKLLPQALSIFGAVAQNGWIYVMGGWNGTKEVTDVYRTAINGDGTLAGWGTAPPLPIPLMYHAVASSDSYMFVTGGQTTVGSGFSSNVYSMRLPSLSLTPTLVSQSAASNGNYGLQLISSTNTGFGIQASTNLATWANIGWGFTDTNGWMTFQDTNSGTFAKRFYRAYWPLP